MGCTAKPSTMVSIFSGVLGWFRTARDARMSGPPISYGLVISIKLVRQTDICPGASLSVSSGGRLRTFFSEILLQDDGVSGVALVDGVGNVAHKRHQANQKVEDDVEDHPHPETGGQSAVNLFAVVDHHHRQSGICCVSNTKIVPC